MTLAQGFFQPSVPEKSTSNFRHVHLGYIAKLILVNVTKDGNKWKCTAFDNLAQNHTKMNRFIKSS